VPKGFASWKAVGVFSAEGERRPHLAGCLTGGTCATDRPVTWEALDSPYRATGETEPR